MNIYPAIGAGITCRMKVKEKMVDRAVAAKEEGENYGFYLKLGTSFIPHILYV